MPLCPYVKEAVFEPKAIKPMEAAFDAVCKCLQLLRPDNRNCGRKIIDIARTGEHDPQGMHDLVVLELKPPDQRSA
jgi:hypothetical protein